MAKGKENKKGDMSSRITRGKDVIPKAFYFFHDKKYYLNISITIENTFYTFLSEENWPSYL